MTERIGRYLIRKRLGGGGFGEVFLAEDPNIGRQVAIKVFRPKDENLIAFATSSNTEGLKILRARFLNEAKILAQLENAAHVVNVLDFGELPDGAPYYVMPYLPHSLADELGRDVFDVKALEDLPAAERPRPMALERMLSISEQLLKGLAAAHAKGLVHRDIKPGNVMLTEEGEVRIVDFGIAKAPDGQHSTISHLGMGSRNYMAPEQRESAKHVDARADVYAVGRVMYRMLTGKLPVGRFADPNVAVPALGKAMNEVILTAISEDRDGRPADAGALLKRFIEARAGVGKQDRSEQSGTWAGEKGASGLRDELKPLKARIEAVIGERGFVSAADVRSFRALAAVGDLDDAGVTRLMVDTLNGDKRLAAKSKLGQLLRAEVAKAGGPLSAEVVSSFEAAGQAVGWDGAHLARVMGWAVADVRGERSEPVRGGPAASAPVKPVRGAAGEGSAARPVAYGRWASVLALLVVLGGGGYGVYVWRQGQLEDERVQRALGEAQASDAAAWKQATGADTAEAYGRYLELWPEGSNAAQARTLQAQRAEQSRLAQMDVKEREAERVRAIQRDLNALGYRVAESGQADTRTREAIKQFEQQQKLVVTGEADEVLAAALQAELVKRDEASWLQALKTDSVAGYEAYARTYPAGRYKAEVDVKIGEVQARLAAEEAEAARIAEEKKKQEEQRQAEAARLAKEREEAEKAQRVLVQEVQQELKRLGRAVPTEGDLDAATGREIKAFEKHLKQKQTGEASAGLLAKLKAAERWPAPSAGDRFRDCEGCPELVVIAGGRFEMGSPSGEEGQQADEGPVRTVRVESFAIGRTEVSFAEYDRFAQATGREKPADGGWGRGMKPVINVSWEDAKAYAAWLSEQTGYAYRLPSEAEWEYAARAGTRGPFSFSGLISPAKANYDSNYSYGGSAKDSAGYRQRTVDVGSLPANAWGLHEVHGNVWEWVEDCWHDSYAGAPGDGAAWVSGGDCGRRVLRGGSWLDGPGWLRSAVRFWNVPSNRDNGLGFRLARTL